MVFSKARTGSAVIVLMTTVFMTIVAVRQPVDTSVTNSNVVKAQDVRAGVATMIHPKLDWVDLESLESTDILEDDIEEVGLTPSPEVEIGPTDEEIAIFVAAVQENEKKAAQNAPETPVNAPTSDSNSEVEYSSGDHLTKRAGVFYGPSGKETYYNLPMGGVIRLMDSEGIEHGEYWVRSDGCKMLGDYIMVASDLSVHPRGTLVETSLGTGIVCDTGTFIYMSGGSNWIDIAVTW